MTDACFTPDAMLALLRYRTKQAFGTNAHPDPGPAVRVSGLLDQRGMLA